MADFSIHALTESEREWVREFWRENWSGEIMIVRGRVFHGAELPGFYAEIDGQRVGLVTYHIDGDSCEIISLDSLREGLGIGSALIEIVKQKALDARCKRLWLITTNDNIDALRFYQKRGFELAAVHRYAVNESRKIKPEIPLTGAYGIPLRDEIELEMRL